MKYVSLRYVRLPFRVLIPMVEVKVEPRLLRHKSLTKVRGVRALCFQGAVDSKSGRKEVGKKAGHLEPVSKFVRVRICCPLPLE